MKIEKLSILFLFFFFLNFQSYSQRVSPDHYLIRFTDKNNSPFSIKHPEKFLSQRAIERRNRFNIPIVKNDLPINPEYIDSLKSIGLKIINKSKWLNCVTVFTKDSSLVEKAQKFSFVVKEKMWWRVNRDSISLPTIQTQEPIQYNRKKAVAIYEYGEGFNQIKMLNTHILHNMGYLGQGIQIAILDAGFLNVNKLRAFDSIRANKQILGVYDFVDKDSMVYDEGTHGMEVLSTIAANIPGEFIGTAPKANFWLFRTEQTKSEYIIEEHNWAAAAEYADSVGVDIIHSSLGYNDFDDSTQNHTYKDMNGRTAISSIAASTAAGKGIIVVVSAGNEGDNSWKYISTPADADSVISVGAVDKNGEYAYFSSIGPTADGRIKPTVCAKGLFATVQNVSGDLGYSSGTSFAAPIMAGAIACLWQAHQKHSNMQIIDAIQKSASQYTKPDFQYGFGIPDFYLAHTILNTIGEFKKNKNEILFSPNQLLIDFNLGYTPFDKDFPAKLAIQIFNLLGQSVFEQIGKENYNMINGMCYNLKNLIVSNQTRKHNQELYEQKNIKQ